MTTTPYDAAFYDLIRPGVRASAAVVVPLLLDLFNPRTVVDVGCGEGWWGQAFADHGCHVLGMDGPYGGAALPDRYVTVDLCEPFGSVARGDLALALEVAEHLPEHRAAGFVEDLCTIAPLVVFSAAVPGQGGTGHVNEQWPAYWAALFASRGFAVSGALRWLIWSDDRVENWYRQNLLVATAAPQRWPHLFGGPYTEPHPVIHPVLYDARRQR